ncbi:MAG: hypothetical protein WEA09_06570 [Gemmatimonadota bacterium]
MTLWMGGCEAADPPDPRAYGEVADAPIHLLMGEEDAPDVVVERSMVVVGGRADGNENEVSLYRVEGAARLDDGSVVVANRSSSELIVVDSSGRRLRTIGGPGSGPGEFRRLVSLIRTDGDTLIAFDADGHRLSWFTADGGAVRQSRIEPPSQASPVGLAEALGVLPDGRVLVWSQVRLTPERIRQLNTPHTADQIERILFTVGADGAAASVVGVFPGPVMYVGPFVAPTGESTVSNQERILSIGDGSMLLLEIGELGVETVRGARYHF